MMNTKTKIVENFCEMEAKFAEYEKKNKVTHMVQFRPHGNRYYSISTSWGHAGLEVTPRGRIKFMGITKKDNKPPKNTKEKRKKVKE